MIYKILGIPYTLILKLIYFNRLKIRGFIFPEGFISISIAENATLEILGNITLRNGAQIKVRKNAVCKIGSKVFFNRNCSVICRENISIGNNVLFGESIKIYDNDHFYDNDKIYTDKFSTLSISIGNNVWIGNDVNILKGSEIPNHTIIGAMSLVNSKLIRPGIYVGIPVKFIKER